MIRTSRLTLMTMIVRAGASGYYVRGNDGFAWLRALAGADVAGAAMIELDCIQGTREWLALRAGISTASCFDQIV